MTNIKETFTDIYVNRKWNDTDKPDEPVSGPGSTLEFTSNLRKELPQLFDTFAIGTVFDAPCGDLHWMKEVLRECPTINYVGGDIVDALIDDHSTTYADNVNINFAKVDIINDTLPEADLLICRDCIFHFSEADIKTFFRNFANSNIAAILVTSDTISDTNQDIKTGDYRLVDLHKAPYNFTNDSIYEIADWPYPTPPTRKMYMWSRDQIAEIVSKF
jgi:hypothetical protein